MFNNKRRIHSAWAKGLMFGKAVGKRDERDRIIEKLEDDYWHHLSYLPRLITEKPTLAHHVECLGCRLIALIKGEQK